MKVVDLFCGCGGLSLGFEQAGFNVLCSYDAWDSAISCYKLNFKHPVVKTDLSDVRAVSKEIAAQAPDIIIGGPPCQDFSHAGKRSEGDRASLTKAYAEIIRNVRPEWFLMENVDRAQNSGAYAAAREIFKSSGYGLTERVLDASFCGVPQKRKRFFCIGKRGENDEFLMPFLEAGLSEGPMTVRDYLGDEFGLTHYYRHPRNYSRRGIFSIDEPAPTVRGVNRPLPSGYTGHPGDPVPVAKIRPLTTIERARLQTFPKRFQWKGTKTDLEQLIGNAVPVKLAKYVAAAILSYASAGSVTKINRRVHLLTKVSRKVAVT
jgi:DNA (cytosine-5)-methyltransferase 1